MDSEKLAEYVIRIDERLASVSSDVKDIKTNFKETSEDVIVLRTEMTNHLSHHEMWENDIRVQMRWWVAIALTAATGSGAMMMGVI